MNAPYILLDWNTIKHLKKPRDDEKNKEWDKELKLVVHNLKKKYKFPYCEAHLVDLAESYSEKNLPFIKSDLEFLSELSEEIALCCTENEEEFSMVKYPVSKLFDEIIKEEKKKPNITPDMNPQGIYKIDMNKIDKSYPMYDLLKSKKGVLGPGIMANYLNELYEQIFTQKDAYENMRNFMPKIKELIKNNKNNYLIKEDEQYFNYLLMCMNSFLDSLDKNEEELMPIWKEVTENYLLITHKKEEINKSLLITIAYNLLDLHPLFKDKLNKKNTAVNIVHDSKTILYASSAKYFVTGDKHCYRKSKFILKAWNLPTEVLTEKEFIAKFS